jgi:hypothetical protein
MATVAINASPPPFYTGQLRHDFQMACARKHPGRILNIGCNEDPTQLRRTLGPRVTNCDMAGWDEHMNRPNAVDCIFNCLETPWPFEDAEAELVILGDILEHFPVPAMMDTLLEARRVAPNVCITVPEDTRIDEAAEQARWDPETYNLHTTVVTRKIIDGILDASNWIPTWFVEGSWGFDGITGFCVLAERT